ncbi:MarR family transcriptional regulator [Bacillus anthracis]|nr:MarR family transcriptional regulator [Bacillus anthracis]
MARRRVSIPVYWGTIILDSFKHLQDNDFTGSDYKVLFFLCEHMTKENNHAYMKQKKIASDMKMDKGNISRSIKKLREKQLIVKAESGFMLNPHLFYVGKRDRDSRIKIRNEFDELIRKQGEEPRFNLNEDDYYLEDFTQPLEDDDDY